MQQLADIATKRWGKKLSSDKLKNLLDKYKRPENCVDIKATKVNPEIWNQLNPNKRKVDLQMFNMQHVVRKVTVATLQTTNVLLQNASGSTNSNLITQSVDIVAFLGNVNTQLAQFRREQIRLVLKQKYSTICSAQVPLTSQYFGMSSSNNCGMLGNLAKLASLWVTLHSDAPILGTTVLATRSVIIKGLKEIFYGKVNTDPTERKASDQRKEIIHQLLAIRDSVSDFPTCLPRLLSYLHDCCHNFKAGRVAAHFAAWKDLTNDRVILSDVLGASIELSANPIQHRLPGHVFNDHEYSVVHQEIQKLIQKGVIMKVKYSPGQIVSGIFLLPKKDGTFRLILNLKSFNEFVTHHHFKMDSLQTIIKLVTPNCFMASIDMKDAYYSIPVKSEDRKYLRFKWEDQFYEFTCLPNGLSCAPTSSLKF